MSIQKIKKEDINFDQIYGTKNDAKNHQNNVKVNEVYWGDNGDLMLDFDEETGIGVVSENGVGLGFVNKDSISMNQPVASDPNSYYDGSYRSNSDIMKQQSGEAYYNGSYRNDSDIMGQISSIEKIDDSSVKSSVPQENVADYTSYEIPDTVQETIEPLATSEDVLPTNEVDNPVEVTETVAPTEETPTETITPIATDETVEEKPSKPIDEVIPSAPEETPSEQVSDDSAIESIKTIDSEEESDDTPSSIAETISDLLNEDDEEEFEEELITPIETGDEEEKHTTHLPEYNPFLKIGRSLETINEEVKRMGGNNGHDLFADAERSGNEEIYKANMNKLLDRLEGVEQQFAADGKGYSFQSTVFSGGKHSTKQDRPTHLMGAKADLRFYKDGVQLDVWNATKEDWQYIKDVLNNNNLQVQYEKHNTVWGDVFLPDAQNINGDIVNYENGWGSGINIHYT